MTMNTKCVACGAFTTMTIAGNPPRFDDLKGNATAKRAAEVALAGGHSITFLSINNGDDAQHLARCVMAQAVPFNVCSVRTVASCECGGFNSVSRECVCTNRELKKWFQRSEFKIALEADIVVEVVETSSAGMTNPPERDEHILERVIRARHARTAANAYPINENGKRLLAAAVDRLRFSERRTAQIVEVARTIAALAENGGDKIEAAHIAEAVQYRAIDRVYGVQS